MLFLSAPFFFLLVVVLEAETERIISPLVVICACVNTMGFCVNGVVGT